MQSTDNSQENKVNKVDKSVRNTQLVDINKQVNKKTTAKNSKNTHNKPSRHKGKTNKMKLSMLRYKITVLFVVLTIFLLVTVIFYESKTDNYKIYVAGNVTEFQSAEETGVLNVQLSVLKGLDCYVYDNEIENKTTVVTPNNKFYIIDYITKTITETETLETIEANFVGENLDDVIISLDNLKKMGGFEIITDRNTKAINIVDMQEYTVSEKLNKQSQYNYFNTELIERYFDYILQNPDLQSVDSIIAVNEGLDQTFYENITEITKPNDFIVLVNKFNALSSVYAPIDLIDGGDGKMLRQSAYKAFDDVARALGKEGRSLYIISAYRSYDRQKTLYDGYVKTDGQEYADKSSARPGCSEHQTGLAMDILHTTNIASSLTEAKFENTYEYRWLVENAYKYGLILRYPEGCEDITGYMYEPWHWRYVGEDVATFMKENDIQTLEEFHAYRGSSEDKFPDLTKRADKAEAFVQTFKLDEKKFDILAYEIDGVNYYNLEDISLEVNDTKFKFKVIYEEENGIINILKGFGSGLTKNIAEITDEFRPYRVSEIEVYVDNFEQSTLYQQYMIDDEYYMSLVDINNLLGFNIKWFSNGNYFEF